MFMGNSKYCVSKTPRPHYALMDEDDWDEIWDTLFNEQSEESDWSFDEDTANLANLVAVAP